MKKQRLFLSGLLAVLATAGLTAAADADKLAPALRAVTAADNYRFVVQEGGAGGTVEGKFQKDTPLSLRADRIDFFRKGELLVYTQGDTWQRTRTGTLSDPLPILGASAKARAVRPPHEELARLGKALTATKSADAEGGTVFTGELAEEAARELARTEDRDLARGGTARLWLDGAGRLVKYEVAIRVKGRRGNADVDGVMTKTVTVDGVGKTKVEVPAAAKKVLE